MSEGSKTYKVRLRGTFGNLYEQRVAKEKCAFPDEVVCQANNGRVTESSLGVLVPQHLPVPQTSPDPPRPVTIDVINGVHVVFGLPD